MISVQQAEQLIAATHRDFGTEKVALADSLGRVLRTPIEADRDFPPFHRVAMDGIAIRWDAQRSLDHSFLVEETQLAGAPQKLLGLHKNCLEVMTGSVCPEGADVVIRYEDVVFEEKDGQRWARITVPAKGIWQNIHQQGTDRAQGAILMESGCIIGAPEIAVAATVGQSYLSVSRLPKVAILSTGDELVPVDQQPAPYQIRMSNSHMIAASLKKWGIDATIFHLTDDKEGLTQKIHDLLKDMDVVLITGGVSKGKTDFIPGILDELGVEKHFHRVAQRPGKPFWFGTREADGGCAVFALPGNPVSTFLCYQRYVAPWLQQCLGIAPKSAIQAILAESITFNPNLSYYLQVKLVSDTAGQLMAYPVKGKGSGDLANLLVSNAFLELPPEKKTFEAGEAFDVYRFGF